MFNYQSKAKYEILTKKEHQRKTKCNKYENGVHVRAVPRHGLTMKDNPDLITTT